MSRLEIKCLAASAGVHALLFSMLALAPLLWSSQRQQIALPVLTFLPAVVVDGAMGGGSPAARTPPAPAPSVPVQQPVVAPPPIVPKPQTAPPKAEPKSAKVDAEVPVRSHPSKNGEPVPSEKKAIESEPFEDIGDARPSRRRPVQISLNQESVSSRRQTAADARAEAQAAAQAFQARYNSKVKGVLGAISEGMSTGTSIEVPGSGGAAYADYKQVVYFVYKQAWTPPPELTDERATVKVRVVILKSGSVESFKVIKDSGHAGLDKSVARLESVRFVARFPDGALDEKRSFIINFNLLL